MATVGNGHHAVCVLLLLAILRTCCAVTLPQGEVRIVSEYSGMGLSFGSVVFQAIQNNSERQRWKVIPHSGFQMIQSVQDPAYCMSNLRNTSDGAILNVETCDDIQASQRFEFRASQGAFVIAVLYSDMCLQISPDSLTAIHALAVQMSCAAVNQQRWSFGEHPVTPAPTPNIGTPAPPTPGPTIAATLPPATAPPPLPTSTAPIPIPIPIPKDTLPPLTPAPASPASPVPPTAAAESETPALPTIVPQTQPPPSPSPPVESLAPKVSEAPLQPSGQPSTFPATMGPPTLPTAAPQDIKQEQLVDDDISSGFTAAAGVLAGASGAGGATRLMIALMPCSGAAQTPRSLHPDAVGGGGK